MLRPYVHRYCHPDKLRGLENGNVTVRVPHAQAALDLWEYIFLYQEPEQIQKLRELLAAEDVPEPKLVLTSQTHTKWLECGTPGYLHPLWHGEIRTIGQLTNATEDELLDIRNVGRKRIDRIKERLDFYGLALRDEE